VQRPAQGLGVARCLALVRRSDAAGGGTDVARPTEMGSRGSRATTLDKPGNTQARQIFPRVAEHNCPEPSRIRILVSFHAPIRSRQNFGSTSSLFSKYTSEYADCVSREQQEVMPKLCLKSDQNMETDSSTDPRAVQITWTIRNRYSRRYEQKCIPPAISLSNGRLLTRLRDLRPYV
jgi:hypothetical protein